MAVIIRQPTAIDDAVIELKTYLPAGRISREDRERADCLETFLSDHLEDLLTNVEHEFNHSGPSVRTWYLLGCDLRTIVSDSSLVSPEDISSGLVWRAIWYHLPAKLKPSGASETTILDPKKLHKRKDHLSLCYEISAFEWNEVDWIQRWDDWHQLGFRPALIRDHRILHSIGEGIRKGKKYPTRKQFREMVKHLGEAFPTKKFRDTEVFTCERIEQIVCRVVNGL